MEFRNATKKVPGTEWMLETRPSRHSRAQSSPPTSVVALITDSRSWSMRSTTPPPTPTSSIWGYSDRKSRVVPEVREEDDALNDTCFLEPLEEPALRLTPSASDVIEFCTKALDYSIDSKRKLGRGRFSDVYQAQVRPVTTVRDIIMTTPPPTPPLGPMLAGSQPTVTSRRQSLTTSSILAVKKPVDKSSVMVLAREAEILSYLTPLDRNTSYIVPFYGRDIRNNALVFEALSCSLESYILTNLNTLSRSARAQALLEIVPGLTQRLIDALSWTHDQGVVHADIKPGNILLRLDDAHTSAVIPYLTDFSASFHVEDTMDSSSLPAGGGTYDYLAPDLLKKSTPAAMPTFATDVWALTMTILVTVLGQSPYASAPNRMVLIEWAKLGRPVDMALNDDMIGHRVAGVSRLRMAFDLDKFWKAGFARDPTKRSLYFAS